jgi:hypothetical protein
MDSNHRSLSRGSRLIVRNVNCGGSTGQPKNFVGYRWFESLSLQRRVSCGSDFVAETGTVGETGDLGRGERILRHRGDAPRRKGGIGQGIGGDRHTRSGSDPQRLRFSVRVFTPTESTLRRLRNQARPGPGFAIGPFGRRLDRERTTASQIAGEPKRRGLGVS